MATTVAQNVESMPAKNLNLLSLDAGGPQGISQLMILKNVMDLISCRSGNDSEGVLKRPCEIFHAIGGAGTGGLIAMFLVVLKMTATEALEEFTSLVNEVFKDVPMDPTKRTEKLKQVIEGILERHDLEKGVQLIRASEPQPTCKLIVPIMYKNNVGVPYVLRNYVAGHEPPADITVAEAMLATCATPPMFTPTSVYKDFSDFEYIGGDLGLSNPTGEIIAEAHRAFGDEATVACLLSIGCGHSGIRSSPSDLGAATWVDFLNRVSVDSEKTAREMARRMKQLTLYHRLSVDYGHATDRLNAWRDPVVIANHTATYLGTLEVAERVNFCVDTIIHGDGFSTLEQLSHSGGANVSSPAMPPLAPHYVERMEATSFVENVMFDQHGAIKPGAKIIVVTGIGGCGKTQLIRKFVEQHGHRFTTVFFADGSSKETFQRDLVRHVRSLGTAHSQKSFDDSMMMLSQPVSGQRLLVIDNVDDPTLDLSPLLPRWSNGAVIVTSRSSSRGQLGQSHLQLDVMSLDESVELLVRGSRREWPPSEADKEANIAVAKELGCHPIALVQAISYMSNTGHSAATYITRLRSHREPLLNGPAINQVEMRYKTAFAAFDASYEILSSNAQKALHLLSFFHWQNFCLDLVSIAAEDNFSTNNYNNLPDGEEFERGKECLTNIFCSFGQWSPVEFDSLITSLRNHSLVAVISTEKITLLQMHPLVHEWARRRIPRNDIRGFQSAAVRLLSCAARDDLHHMMQYVSVHVQALSHVWRDLHVNDTLDFAFIMKQSGLYNHAANLQESGYTRLKEQLGVDHLNTITVAANLAFLYRELGRYSEAEELQREVLQRKIAQLGVDHPETIAGSANLAGTYGRLGRFGEAEVMEKEVLQRSRTILGVDHPDTITASACLAATYRELGRYGEAEEWEKEVLQRRRAILGEDHPDTITASACLATTYYKLGRYGEAEELEEEVLQWRRTVLGVDHPDTINASACLAATYRQLGRYGEAEEWEKEVLQWRRTVLGEDHPDTINASAHLATTYYKLGRYGEAEELQKEVLQRSRTILGEDHPDTINASAHLATTYYKLGRYGEAEELEEEVLQWRRTVLGEDHPDTIAGSANLAGTYGRLGRFGEAEVMEKEVLQRSRTILGVDHPDTITASACLAATYRELGRYGEAEEWEKEVLQRRRTVLGEDHPDTINASAHLATTYYKLGRYGEAEELQKEVLQRSRTILGEDHPDTINASAYLAATYCQLGRYDEAEELQQEVLQRRRTILGVDHPDTITASACLAATYRQLGRYGEAEEWEKEVLQRRRAILGEDHPDTITASACLATTYYKLGRYGEVEELQKEVLQRRRTVMGVDHPDTITASENLAGTYYTLTRYAEAEALERDVLRQRNAILGNRHRDTLSAMVHLAEVYEATRRLPEAIELARNATQMLLETQGEMHPLYIQASTLLASLTGGPPSDRRRDRILGDMRRIFSLHSFIHRLRRQA